MITSKNIKLDEMLFISSYAIYLIMNTLHDSFFANAIGITLYKLSVIGAGLILLVKESLHPAESKKTIIQILISLFLAVLIIKNSTNYSQISVAFMVFYAISGRTLTFDKVVHYSLTLSVISLAIVVLCSQAGIINDYVAYDLGRNRHYLGFLYALYPSTILFNILGLKFISGSNTRKDMLIWTLLTVASIWMYVKTDSRTCFGMSIVMIFLHLVMLIKPDIFDSRFFHFLMIISIPVLALAGIYLTVRYDSTVAWQAWLNRKLAKRLYYGQQSLQMSGYKLFGQKINWTGYGLNEFGIASNAAVNFVDNMYIKVLQRYGLIFFVSWLTLMTRAMYLVCKNKKDRLAVFCVIVAAHCVLDDLSMFLNYNTVWMLLGCVLIGNMPSEDTDISG